jgi:hypothetical protein
MKCLTVTWKGQAFALVVGNCDELLQFTSEMLNVVPFEVGTVTFR